jgi:hypothetical protein
MEMLNEFLGDRKAFTIPGMPDDVYLQNGRQHHISFSVIHVENDRRLNHFGILSPLVDWSATEPEKG